MEQLLRCAERNRERPADVRRREMLKEFDRLINHKVSGKTMARGRNAKKKPVDKRGPLQRMHDRARAEGEAIPVVNDFARQHGDYEKQGEYGDARHVMVNTSGNPVARWRKAGLVTASQDAAIEHCIHLWEKIETSSRMVANLDRTVFGSHGDGHPKEVEARADLQRLKSHVGQKYWDIFENVVRFDEPAGVAGSRLEKNTRNRETAARSCVLFVADIIAMREHLSY